MLETDRDLYLAFAGAMSLDFEWVQGLIDGRVSAGPAQANTLAYYTGSSSYIWTRENMGPVRLVAVKIWAVKERRQGRSPLPAGPEEHLDPDGPRACRFCD
jgi:hypothetical protein